MTWILLIATVVTLVAGGGAVYVADAAVPGDALYGLDISIENVRLNLASTPEKTARLQLAFATERLQEAQKLMDAGDVDHYQVALSAYGDSISGAAQTLGTAVGADQETLANLLEEALAVHDTVLGTFVTGPNGAVNNGDGDGEVDLSRCENMIDHPIAQAIADQYEVPVEEVMALFCNGAGFGEIMLAYSISEDTGIPVSDLFALRDAGLGWGQIMQNVGLIGRPDDVPQGPPDDVPQGPPDDVPQGPPDDVPQGPPDDVPQGPPDDVPQGPPDDVPQGPPDDVPQGPPDDVPQGPPDDAPQGPPDDAPQGPPENSGPPAGTGGGRP
ncbi:MAG: hypothetical protein IAE79_25300 [Anaerolinea sp.]|nr:hypothetical protein [Anaerolinea sp.]